MSEKLSGKNILHVGGSDWEHHPITLYRDLGVFGKWEDTEALADEIATLRKIAQEKAA